MAGSAEFTEHTIGLRHLRRIDARGVLRRWAIVGLFAVGLVGVALRFHGLSSRFFWADEVVTDVRLSGYTFVQVFHEFYDGKLHTVAQLRRFTGVHDGRGVDATVRSLAAEDAQHPPLYYIVTYYFAKAFGSSAAELRAPAAIFGALVPIAVALLCWELFGSFLAALFGFALASLSPVLVVYSHQAREYSLWALLTALSTLLLLRAAKARSRKLWIFYAAACVAGLYTDVLFVLVLLGHAAYALLSLRGSSRRWSIVAFTVAAAAFVPWAILIERGQSGIDRVNAWTATPWPLHMIVEKWIFNIGATFFDVEYARAAYTAILVPILLIAGYAFYRLFKHGTLDQRIVIAALVLPTVLFLALPDLALHHHRSTVTRYGMPVYLALIVVVAGMLANRVHVRSLGAAAAAFVLVCCAFWSSVVDVSSSVWWDNHGDADDLKTAAVVNSAPDALVVVHKNVGRLVAFGLRLHNDIHVQPFPQAGATAPAGGYENTFLFGWNSDAAAYRRLLGPNRVVPVFIARESNTQLQSFRRGTARADASDSMSLWLLK
jgi:uncharacterized membrane protein